MFNKVSTRTSFTTIPPLWWPTTVKAKPKTSRQKQNTSHQNQKPHGKNKIPHGKTKNFTAKTKTSRLNQKLHMKQKQNTSWQNQILHSKSKIALVLPWVLLLPWGIWFLLWSIWFLLWSIWFLLWSIWFCCEVFIFAVRFSVLPWGILFLSWGFSLLVLPWQLWATVPATVNDAVLGTRKLWQDVGHVTYLSLLRGMGGWSHRSPNR